MRPEFRDRLTIPTIYSTNRSTTLRKFLAELAQTRASKKSLDRAEGRESTGTPQLWSFGVGTFMSV
jgi:hypothetical protein